jgi:hypothetical protein
MGSYINSVGFATLFILASSCQNRIVHSSYPKSNDLYLDVYFGAYCEQRSAIYRCDDLLFPNLGVFLEKKAIETISSKITDMGINVSSQESVNAYSKNIWSHEENNTPFDSRKIDILHIINTVNSANKTVLVPIFHIFEYFSMDSVGRTYHVKLALSIIILKDNEVIYSNFRNGKTKVLHFYDLTAFGEEMSLINLHNKVNVEKMIQKTVNRVMRPYLKRLK